MNHKSYRDGLPGFTLVEILVAMMIGSVLIGIIFSLIFLFHTLAYKNVSESTVNNDAVYISNLLSEMTFDADRIISSGETGISFIDRRKKVTTIDFIVDGLVIRSGQTSDSIGLEWSNLSIVPIGRDQKLIKRCSFTINNNQLEYYISIRKDYSASLLLGLIKDSI